MNLACQLSAFPLESRLSLAVSNSKNDPENSVVIGHLEAQLLYTTGNIMVYVHLYRKWLTYAKLDTFI